LKDFIKKIKEKLIWCFFWLHSLTFNKKKVYILDVGMYANLGDQAIIHAEKKFLQDHFKNIKIIEVSSYIMDKPKLYQKLVKKVTPEDVLFFHGGGSLDDRASKVVGRFCRIAEDFINHRIIMFPQTISFSDSKESKMLLRKLQESFNGHPDLVLCAREKISYDLLKKYFPNSKVILTPDIVLYLKFPIDVPEKKQIVCLFRDDVELTLTNNDKKVIEKELTKFRDYQVIWSDTVLKKKNHKIRKSYFWNRLFYIKRLCKQISSSSLVITDRLHGMVFAAITGVKVIVLPSLSHKVIGVYDWLSQLESIKYIDDFSSLESKIREMLKQNKKKEERIKEIDLYQFYEPLLNEMRKGTLHEYQK